MLKPPKTTAQDQAVRLGVQIRLARNEADDLLKLLRRYDARARKLAERFDVIEDLDAELKARRA